MKTRLMICLMGAFLILAAGLSAGTDNNNHGQKRIIDLKQTPYVLFIQGKQLYDQKQYVKASQLLEIAVNTGYGKHEAYYFLSRCYWEIKETSRAIFFMEKAVQLLEQQVSVGPTLQASLDTH